MNKNEIWKDIPNYEGYYQASNLGNIRNYKTMRILKPYIIKKYYAVKLSKFGKTKNYYIHRLILETFIGNSNIKDEVNHINGKHFDNRLINLEWCTGAENLKHAIKNNLRGSKRKKVNQYDMQGNFIKTWNSQSEPAFVLGIHVSGINACCKGNRNSAGNYIWKNQKK